MNEMRWKSDEARPVPSGVGAFLKLRLFRISPILRSAIARCRRYFGYLGMSWAILVVKMLQLPKSGVDGPWAVKKISYVLYNSLPYASAGYATRGHSVAVALRKLGYDLELVTRPGFPVDLAEAPIDSFIPNLSDIDGVPYVRLKEPSKRGLDNFSYMIRSAAALENHFRHSKPDLVIAASNFLNAIPSLLAARRAGIPFIYEVRGMWEITRQSRDPSYGGSFEFKVYRFLETFACRHADLVLTLTGPMRDDLISRGIDPTRIKLVPNSCNVEAFQPRARDRVLAEHLNIASDIPVIGYVGSFVQYEGLDDLALACAELKRRGIQFRLLLVGKEKTADGKPGTITSSIVEAAEAGGYSEWLIMPGRVEHEEVPRYYSLIDIAPFPRKAQLVTELVSPLKPLEAMGMCKAVIVSSVRAMAEMVQEGETGLIFEKGSIEDVANKLALLVQGPDRRAKRGQNARDWVARERTWEGTWLAVLEQSCPLKN